MGGLRANRARRAPGVLTVGWAGCRSSVPVSFRSIRIRIPVPRSRIHTTPRCSAASSTTPRCRTISPIQASTASPSRHRTTRPPSGEGVMGSAAEARVRRDRPPSSSGTTGSTGPLPEGPENGAGTDMTGASFSQQTGELTSTDQRTRGDTSWQPACCRSHGGEGAPPRRHERPHGGDGHTGELRHDPPGWRHHRSQQPQPPPPPNPKRPTAGPILPNSKYACHYGGGPFHADSCTEVPSPSTAA